MIWGAALLVLAGLGLFVGGHVTGDPALYWACVGVCVVAALLLVVARRAPAGAGGGEPPARRRREGRAPVPVAVPPGSPAVPPAAVGPPRGQHAAEPADEFPEEPGEELPYEPADELPAPGPAVGGRAVEPGAPVGGRPVGADPHRRAGRADTGGARSWGGAARSRHRGAHAASEEPTGRAPAIGEPGIEEVEVTDLLLVVDLTDEVLVVDEHPRYHLAGCRHLVGREAIPLPLDEARTDGFTPCAVCAPDRHLAERERARKAGRGR